MVALVHILDCQFDLPKCFICVPLGTSIVNCCTSAHLGLPVRPSCSINWRRGSHWNSNAAARPSINLREFFKSYFRITFHFVFILAVKSESPFFNGTTLSSKNPSLPRRRRSSFKIRKALKRVNFSFTLRSLQSCCWLGTPLHRSSYIFSLSSYWYFFFTFAQVLSISLRLFLFSFLFLSTCLPTCQFLSITSSHKSLFNSAEIYAKVKCVLFRSTLTLTRMLTWWQQTRG